MTEGLSCFHQLMRPLSNSVYRVRQVAKIVLKWNSPTEPKRNQPVLQHKRFNEVRQPIGGDGVSVTEDMTPETEGEWPRLCVFGGLRTKLAARHSNEELVGVVAGARHKK